MGLYLMDFLEGHISLVLASCHGKIITAALAFYRIIGLDPQKSNHASEIYIPPKIRAKAPENGWVARRAPTKLKWSSCKWQKRK